MQQKHSVTDLFFTLTLFAVFAACALLVVVIGAGVYRSTVAGMGENYSTRTAVAYVSEKVREFDRVDENGPAVTLGAFPDEADLPALILYREADEQTVLVYIYYYDGALRELATTDQYAPSTSPDAGQPVAELTGASFEQLKDGLFEFTAAGELGAEKLLFTLHSYR